MEDLSSDNNTESKPRRAKWKCRNNVVVDSKSHNNVLNFPAKTAGPVKMKSCIKLWQTDGVNTRLFFSSNGQALAASGAHNSVQVTFFRQS
jgi:hypothetical protein